MTPGPAGEALRTDREADVLLATKLHAPPQRRDLLARPRLFRRLGDGSLHSLVVVSAPAGFGKSTVLAQWARTLNPRVAWVALDADDNDPARFWRYIVAALEQVQPGVEKQVVPLLFAPEPPGLEAVATAVVNELAAGANEVVVVLDDYQVIESTVIHESISFLLEHAPPGLHLVISGRTDPPLGLARLRGRGQLAELRADDLRFTSKECAALLGEVWGLSLSDASLAALENRTEGWVTGFQLAARSLRVAPDPAAFIEGFTGSNRHVFDYLTEEVLEQQPDHVLRFLLDTSILDRLTGSLCDALTGQADGQAILEDLERANLFLDALDQDRHWYRYHGLFADLLRSRLAGEGSEQVAQLHRRAAAWCDGNGLVHEAVRHALAAGDPAMAAGIVEHSIDAILSRGQGATLRRWLAALPEPAVRSRPRLCLVQAITEFNAGRLSAVESLLASAERALAADPERFLAVADADETALANIPALVANLRASLAGAHGDAVKTIKFAEEALAHLRAGEHGSLLPVRWNLALGQWLQGRLTDAESAFAQIVTEGRATERPHLALTAGAFLGRVQHATGRLGAALGTYREGLEFAARGGQSIVLSAGVAHVGIAGVFYARNQLDDARRHVDKGIALCRHLTATQPLAQGLATLAWIRYAGGDASGAMQAMEEARRAFPDPDVVSLYNPVPAERARLLLALGNATGAADWIQERGIGASDEPCYPRELEYLVLARLLLARGAPDRALGLLERLGAIAEAQGRTASVIEVRALEALCRQAAGDHPGAMAALVAGLALAQGERHVRVFADEGTVMASLLRAVVGARGPDRPRSPEGIAIDYVGLLLAAVRPGASAGPSGAPGGSRLVEALTGREFQVLEMIAAGKSNREIAGELVVTLDTVKKHLTHTFEKLGATNRNQAVARARQLGLIS